MYKVYKRLPNQNVSDKTTTRSPIVAETAFRELLRSATQEKAAVVLSFNNKQLEYVRLDMPCNPNMEIRLF